VDSPLELAQLVDDVVLIQRNLDHEGGTMNQPVPRFATRVDHVGAVIAEV
jgi:hypothetical protein